jgi:thioredoxin-like negative regulator of GroEL
MIIKFYTEGCQPCKALTTLLDNMMVEYVSCNREEEWLLAADNRIMSVPTLLNTETGKRLIGFKNKEKVKEFLNDNCS